MKLKNLFKGFKAKKSAMFMLALLALQGSAGISKVSADTVAENVNVSSEYVKVNSSKGVHDVGKITIKKNGKEDLAFCIEPDVITPLGDNSGYVGKDRTDISARTEQIATLWNNVSADIWYYRVAQTMIWEQVNGIQIYSIDGLSDTDYQNIKSQINQAVDNYNKKPSFNGQSVTVKLGETVKLSDSNNSGLNTFDNMRLNSANVDYSVNGNELSITPKADSKLDGTLRFAKTVAVGTSVVYQKSDSQTLMVAKITDPAFYNINLKVIKTGKSQIQKLDAETGKPMAGVKFKMSVDGTDYDVTTNSKGIGFIDKEFLHKQIAMPCMKELSREFRETVSLAFLFENHIEVVEVVESPQKVQMGNVVGGVIPPHASSLGKSITAHQPEGRREKLLRAYGICQFTPGTITD